MDYFKSVTRKKLGLVFFNDEKWIGGTYYTVNLIHALNSLEDCSKPEIIVFSNIADFEKLSVETSYPYIYFDDYVKSKFSKFERLINKISAKIFQIKAIKKRYKNDIDAFFITQRSEFFEAIPVDKRIYWIPDFQEKYYPHFLDKENLQKKHEKNIWVEQNAKKIIHSSQSVKKDWQTFYPNFSGVSFVVNFAVTHPEFESLDICLILKKYQLPKDYFFSPNQFWAHKNHMIVIKAAEELKRRGEKIVVVFTGKEFDHRNPGYTETLKKYVNEKNLEDVVKFLGFLERREQLILMKHAIAVIQPSLFEGWSTVIEDAKAMNQLVIASNLDVHQDQLNEKGIYFNPIDVMDLSNCILKIMKNKPIVEYNYSKNVKEFATVFLTLLENDK